MNVPLPKATTVMVIGLSVSTPWGVTSADVEVASLAMALTVKVRPKLTCTCMYHPL